jgi:hypothetical protein
MKCARTACQTPLDGEQHIAIWNEPSTGQPRLYCVFCGMKIIRGNEHDTLKLQHELREPLTPTDEA